MFKDKLKLIFLCIAFLNIAFLIYVLQAKLWGLYLFLFLYLFAAFVLYKVIEEDRHLRSVLQKKFAQKENLAILGQMSSNIIHEIRNPLTTIKGFSTLLNNKLADNELRSYCQLMLKETDNINKVISAFYRYAKPQSPSFKELFLDEIIINLKASIDPKCQENNISILYNLNCAEMQVLADLEQLQEVILHVVQNSIEALEGRSDGKIEISTSYSRLTDEVVLQIIDNGRGMTREEKLLAGTPFYSLKNNSVGLGLSICYQYINEHNGYIEIHSNLGMGTDLSIFLPSLTSNKKTSHLSISN
jgi:signal transduction histidine kinase